MMSVRIVKLVRDRVHEYVHDKHGSYGEIGYGTLTDDEYIKRLRMKLIEEAAEYMADPSVEELADVLEVVWALARNDQGIIIADLEAEAYRKSAQRGGFNNGVALMVEYDGG
jgi:predicted house-cleaning noncanonical NTP pyrophosphatase (MazG superfamily)